MVEKLDIITIGESLIELSSDESLSSAKSLNKYYGGDTICTAVAAARLGSKVGYVTRVGNDYFREYLLDSWQSEDIDISHVKLVDGFNGVYFIARLETGEKEFSYYRKKTAATNLSVNDITQEYIDSAQIVYSTGIAQSLSPSAKEAVKKAFELAKANGAIVAYDPNYTPLLWTAEETREAFEEIIELVDILLINSKHDAKKLFDIDSADKIIKTFWDKGVNTVVVKSPNDGYCVGYNGEVVKAPFYFEKTKDTTSTGDAFNGGFLHGIADGYTPFEAVQLASIVAGFQTQKIGAIKSLPKKDEVYKEFGHLNG